ncbi:MAG: hypothetical protein COA32_09735 [Fluviicola sp.]|nr:MAG: hypothetical protein COA32_09735 [Fluviicola sp.]
MRLLLTLSIITIIYSCGGQSKTGDEVLTSEIKEQIQKRKSYARFIVNEVENIKDITVQDSLLIASKKLKAVQNTYDEILNELSAGARLAERPRSKMYYSDGEVNKYHKGELDKLVKDMRKNCQDISEIYQASKGNFEDNNYAHMFKPLESLKNREPNEVIGKIYKINYEYSLHHSQHKAQYKTLFIILNPSENRVLHTLDEKDFNDNFEIPVGEEVNLDIKQYKVTDDGYVQEITSDNSKKEVSIKKDSTMILKYVGGEFRGSCLTLFEDEQGEQIMIWNANLDKYANPDNSCKMKDEFLNQKFNVTYKLGEVDVYQEGVEDSVLENEVIISKISLLE